MSVSPRRIKVVTNPNRGARIIDLETGADLSNAISEIRLRMDQRTGMHMVAEVTFVDVEVVATEVNVEVETRVSYRRLTER